MSLVFLVFCPLRPWLLSAPADGQPTSVYLPSCAVRRKGKKYILATLVLPRPCLRTPFQASRWRSSLVRFPHYADLNRPVAT